MAKIVPYLVEALFVSDVLTFSLEISTVDDGIYRLREGLQIPTTGNSTNPFEPK